LARGLAWVPLAIVLAVSLYYIDSALEHLDSTVSHPDQVAEFMHADSMHYLEMAEAFAEGEFTRCYVRIRPHRQPLYPALLAIAVRTGGERNLFFLGMVNVLIGLTTIWLIFILASQVFSSPMVGALTALLYQRNDFVFDYITDRIMTEPLYTLSSFVTLALALLYVKHGKARSLYLASFAGGLAYLTRPNGFFLMAALWGVLFASEILVLARDRGWKRPELRDLRGMAWRFGIAGLIFLAIAIPSWVPRLAYYGNPFHHGVVGNAIWVDTWEELRANQDEPLGPSHYFASHGLSEVLERFHYGFEVVYLTAPQHYTPRIHLLAAAGLLVAALRRRRRDLVLVATAFLTLLPITWTSLPMPFTRIAYGAQLAFILLFSAILLEFVRDLAVRAIPGFGAGTEKETARAR
jgi:hypothetical protein